MKKGKYALDTKKYQLVYLIELNILTGVTMSSFEKNGLFITELKIVHQTPHKIVLSDPFVTVLDRKKEGRRSESYYKYLGDISVNIKTKETFFSNGIFCRCYTIEKPEKVIKEMKRKMISKIHSEYGFLRDLDIENKIMEMEVSK